MSTYKIKEVNGILYYNLTEITNNFGLDFNKIIYCIYNRYLKDKIPIDEFNNNIKFIYISKFYINYSNDFGNFNINVPISELHILYLLFKYIEFENISKKNYIHNENNIIIIEKYKSIFFPNNTKSARKI